MLRCKQCNLELTRRHQYEYCSNKCQTEKKFHQYISEWKKEKQTGNIGIHTGNISGHIKKYLRQKYPRCCLCGWDRIHSLSGRVPLEIDHIDGNSLNNKESNLRMLCPNCHSLTGTYKNFNNGNGRAWRKNKYLKNKRV